MMRLNRGKGVMGVLMLWCLVITVSISASIDARLQPDRAVEGEEVTLIIKAQGERVALPRLERIGTEPIISKSQEEQISVQIVNSKKTVQKTKIFRFVFRARHSMQIDPITLNVDGKNLQTPTLHLQVTPATTQTHRSSNAPYEVALSLDRNKSVVGESTVLRLIIRIKEGVDVRGLELVSLDLAGMLSKQEGRQHRYKQGDYIVHELRYILTPTGEGNVTVGPARIRLGLPRRESLGFFSMIGSLRYVTLQSDPVKLEVLPKPADVDVVGTFRIEAKLDRNQTEANEPVELTLSLKGRGDLSDFDLEEFRIAGVSVFSDAPQVQTRIDGEGVYSEWKKTFSFIADRNFTIPSVTLKGYDSKTKQSYTLQTEPLHVHVKSKPGTAVLKQEAKPLVRGAQNTTSTTPSPHTQSQKAPWWQLLVAFLAGAITFWGAQALYRIKVQSKGTQIVRSDALYALLGHLDDPEALRMVEKLYAKKRGEKVTIDKKKLKALLEKYKR